MKVSLEPGQLTSQERYTRSETGNKQNSALSSSESGNQAKEALSCSCQALVVLCLDTFQWSAMPEFLASPALTTRYSCSTELSEVLTLCLGSRKKN